MNENQKYKLKYDELRENGLAQKGTKPKPTSEDSSINVEEDIDYEQFGTTRNLGLAWPDGRRMFFNYAYLVSTELNVNDEINGLTLLFTSQVVMLKGYNLKVLYRELFFQRCNVITLVDQRYSKTDSDDNFTIIEILVSSN